MPLVIGAAGEGRTMALAALAIVLAAAGTALVSAFLRWRGTRLVRCPETRRPVAVELDVRGAVLGSLFSQPELRLRDCSRWPERRDCGQGCMPQIARAPEDCLVSRIVAEWYRGKRCVYCGTRFEALHWHDRRPAMRSPGGVTIQWCDVRPETLPAVFETHRPVCWNCHVAESFRREHPEVIVDRPPPPGPGDRSRPTNPPVA